MFIGHFGAGLAAKSFDKKILLGVLILASQFADLIWPVLVLLKLEKVAIETGFTSTAQLNLAGYPWSHSLPAVIMWAFLLGIIYYLVKKDFFSSLIVGTLVVSHWVLDLFTQSFDLKIFPWLGYKAGFGLWNSILLTILVEAALFIVGVYLFWRVTKTKDAKYNVRFWSFVIFLIIVYVMTVFGPPPPSEMELVYTSLSLWIFVLWGFWIDNKVKA